jgi:hypothetical protein
VDSSVERCVRTIEINLIGTYLCSKAVLPWMIAGGGGTIKTPEEVAPLAVFLATQPRGGPTGQSFSLAHRPL